jgi:hypothetical protein
MTKPDIDLITGFTKTVTKSGYSTTYSFSRDDVALQTLLGSKKSTSTLGSIRWTITVGSQGEVSQSTLKVMSKKSTTTISVKVLSYNQPLKIAAPSAHDVTPISGKALERLLSAEKFTSFLIPRDFTSLSQTNLS